MVAHSTSGDFGSRYKYNGKELDKATGWYYYGARYTILGPCNSEKGSSIYSKGIVAPTGKQGIIKLTKTEAAKTGFTHKIKILGKGDKNIWKSRQ